MKKKYLVTVSSGNLTNNYIVESNLDLLEDDNKQFFIKKFCDESRYSTFHWKFVIKDFDKVPQLVYEESVKTVSVKVLKLYTLNGSN